MGLEGILQQPKARDTITISCHNCLRKRTAEFREILRTMTIVSNYAHNYHCRNCLTKLPEYVRSRSAPATMTKEERSRISKSLWQNEEYRKKVEASQSYRNDEWRQAISNSLKEKFRKDSDYRHKIIEARKQVWQDLKYRSSRVLSTAEFTQRAQLVHGHKYDYSSVVYKTSDEKVDIICPIHGLFQQRPSHHLHYKNGCPKCAWCITSSTPQLQLADRISSSFNCKVELNYELECGLQLDIYVPEKSLAIEYHGGYWHSCGSEETNYLRNRHQIKANKAHEEGIKLYQFFDYELQERNDIVWSMINHAMGNSTKLFARKLQFGEVDKKQMAIFFNNNHIGGNQPAELCYGLYQKESLISAVSLRKRQRDYEIVRFATTLGTTVIGGLSKIIHKIGPILNYPDLFSYANQRYSKAKGGYAAAGFSHLGTTKPGYMWWKSNKYYDRRLYQKHKLAAKLPLFDVDLT